MKINKSHSFVLAIAAATTVFLSACNISPPEGDAPALTFEQVAPVSLNVSRVDFSDSYRFVLQPPHVEHLFKQPPATAAAALVARQIRPDGAGRILKVRVEEASVIEKTVTPQKGIVDMLNRKVAARYEGKIVLVFEAVDEMAPDIVVAHARVMSERSKEILSGASLAERDRVFFDLNEAMMNDLSQGIATTVRDTFGFR